MTLYLLINCVSLSKQYKLTPCLLSTFLEEPWLPLRFYNKTFYRVKSLAKCPTANPDDQLTTFGLAPANIALEAIGTCIAFLPATCALNIDNI